MSDPLWLRAADCPLLQADAGTPDPLYLRLVQRLLELALAHHGSEETAAALLEEVGAALQADQAAVLEASPQWQPRWQYTRRGVRPLGDSLPRTLLQDALERDDEAAGQAAPAGGHSFLVARLRLAELPNAVLLVARPRNSFSHAELEYVAAAAHCLNVGLERGQAWDERTAELERLRALVTIGRQLAEQRETTTLLGHIADQAIRLLRCERSSIFLWDQARKELVGRPAVGIAAGDLRIPDHTGVAGQVLQTGKVVQVDDTHSNSAWSPSVDQDTGFQTRSLLCVPMADAKGARLGVVQAINKAQGRFSKQDVETLQNLASYTAAALQNVQERETLLRSNAQLEGEARQRGDIVGSTSVVHAIKAKAERVAPTELHVLILGENGTGKEVVARFIHYHSPARKNKPFVPVNCAAIPETLLESELFGHEKGAFTDARETKQGKFELASGGTLFLDEIGELSAGGQAKLLRVLEDKVVYRVGGGRAIPVDTRIVAATNRNLEELVRQGRFREDLFYRLTVVRLELPPLRERREDIRVLAEHFLGQFCRGAGRRPPELTADAWKRLEQHSWPGNVRELRNVMEQVAFLCPTDRVEGGDLPIISRTAAGGGEADRYANLPLSEATDQFQRDHIRRAIERAGGNMSDAAELLKLHRSNLYRKMKGLGMEVP